MPTIPLQAALVGLLMTPLTALPVTTGAQASPLTPIAAQREPVELLGAASETTRYWLHPDGHITTEIWSRPVRVKKSNAWAWIDPSLSLQGSAIKPKVVKGELTLPRGGDASPSTTFALTPDQSLALSWPAKLPEPTLEGSRATYTNAAGPGADLVVTALAAGFRYDLVLRERPAKAPQFEIPVKGNGLKLRETSGGRVRVTDGDDQNVAVPSKPWLESSKAAQSRGAVEAAVVTSGGGQTLVLKPDQKYLVDPATSYPVTIQSAFSIVPSADADVWSLLPDYPNGDGGTLKAGTESDGSKSRAYLKFNTSPLIGQQITNVTLSLLNIDGPSCGSAVGEAYRYGASLAGGIRPQSPGRLSRPTPPRTPSPIGAASVDPAARLL
ncbi:hypothetical protein Nocox_07760 [Nonomuraea coxensis DSM 45129]|uniref:Uncharacterized protein n=1 Tax=Nonomuraea coxensis DSM 45129 TaxID=1122611 RepID=A0ABX8TXI9_9ACTN|nr:hypothetical protein Nocox_07760 [Nonomuraea coxensis DSM 45129]